MVSLLCPKSTNATSLGLSASKSAFLKKPYVNAVAVDSFMSLTHLIPAISAASKYAYLSAFDAYVGTEITISFDGIFAFSKYVFIFLR